MGRLVESRSVEEFRHEGFVVRCKRVAAQPYVGVGGEISLEELDGFIAKNLSALGVEEGEPYFVLYHEALAPGTPALVEVCRASSPDEAYAELPAGEVVYTIANGEQTEFPEIANAYDALTLWAQDFGREVLSPAREAHAANGSLEISKPLREPD